MCDRDNSDVRALENARRYLHRGLQHNPHKMGYAEPEFGGMNTDDVVTYEDVLEPEGPDQGAPIDVLIKREEREDSLFITTLEEGATWANMTSLNDVSDVHIVDEDDDYGGFGFGDGVRLDPFDLWHNCETKRALAIFLLGYEADEVDTEHYGELFEEDEIDTEFNGGMFETDELLPVRGLRRANADAHDEYGNSHSPIFRRQLRIHRCRRMDRKNREWYKNAHLCGSSECVVPAPRFSLFAEFEDDAFARRLEQINPEDTKRWAKQLPLDTSWNIGTYSRKELEAAGVALNVA